MLCAVCKNELPENAKFCMSCGAKVLSELKCPACGEKLPVGAKFCLVCGKSVEDHRNGNGTRGNNESYTLFGQVINYSSTDVKVYSLIENMSDHAYNIIYDKYISARNLKRVAEDFSDIIQNGYLSSTKKLVDIISKTSKRYDLTEEDLLKLSDSFYNINQFNAFLLESYNELQSDMDDAKSHREFRKASRSRVIGGGFGVSGAVKGMATATAFNMLSGAAHSVFNAVDGALTNDRIEAQMQEIYAFGKEKLYQPIFADMTNIVLAVAKEYLGMNVDNYSLTEANSNKAKSIFSAIEEGKVPKNELQEQIAKAIEYNVCNSESYIKAYNLVGDTDKSLQSLAEKLSLTKVLKHIKNSEAVKVRKKFKIEFSTLDKNDRDSLIAFKKSFEETGLYSSADKFSQAIDESIYNAEILTIKNMMQSYDGIKSHADAEEIINKKFSAEVVQTYFEWLMLKVLDKDIDKTDKGALLSYKDKLANCKYISNDSEPWKRLEKCLNVFDIDEEWRNLDKDNFKALRKFWDKIQDSNVDVVTKHQYMEKTKKYLDIARADEDLKRELDKVDVTDKRQVKKFFELNIYGEYPSEVFNKYRKLLEDKVKDYSSAVPAPMVKNISEFTNNSVEPNPFENDTRLLAAIKEYNNCVSFDSQNMFFSSETFSRGSALLERFKGYFANLLPGEQINDDEIIVFEQNGYEKKWGFIITIKGDLYILSKDFNGKINCKDIDKNPAPHFDSGFLNDDIYFCINGEKCDLNMMSGSEAPRKIFEILSSMFYNTEISKVSNKVVYSENNNNTEVASVIFNEQSTVKEDEEVTSSDYPISISIFGNMFNKYIEEVRKDGGKSFYSFANLDAKKIGNFCMYANEKFNRSPKHDEVVAYYDSTMFGKGNEGVAVALDGVYYLSDKEHIYEYVSYNDMNQPAVYDSGMFSNNIIVNTSSGEVKMALYADGASGVRREIVNVINYIRSKVKSKVIDVSKVADESEIPPTGNTDDLCTYKITLRDCGTLSKIDAIKAIRKVLDLDISLSDAKSLVDKVPSVLVPNCSFDEMTKLRQELNDAGLTVDISKN